MDEDLEAIEEVEYDLSEFEDCIADESLLLDLDIVEDELVLVFNPEDDPTEEVVCSIGEFSSDEFSSFESEDLEDQDYDEIDNDPVIEDE